MMTLGVDAHKKLHVATALDETGHEIGQWRGPNSDAGWQSALRWAIALGAPHQWGIEGAWGYGRGLAQYLVACGEPVYEVNTRWTTFGRRHARRLGKTDPLDARAVAMFVLQEAPDLPRVGAEDVTVVLDLLTSEREALRSETRRLWNQNPRASAPDRSRVQEPPSKLRLSVSAGDPRGIRSAEHRLSSARTSCGGSTTCSATSPRTRTSGRVGAGNRDANRGRRVFTAN